MTPTVLTAFTKASVFASNKLPWIDSIMTHYVSELLPSSNPSVKSR